MSFWQKLPKPFFILAPMEDVTDTVFRQLVGMCAKPDVYFTEFVSVDGLCSKGREKIIHRLQFTQKERPIIAQVWGLVPEHYYRSAKMIVDMGFDGIDINMGCPVEKVLVHGCCAALIENRTLAGEIIKATKEGAGDLPVSVKTRIGYKKIVTEDWVEFLLKQDIIALTVHGRTASELSKVPADWDEIGKAVTVRNQLKSSTLIVGNGDVKSQEEGRQKCKTYGVDGVMIGRGIFDNLWLFDRSGKTHAFTSHERLSLLLTHVRLFDKTWGKSKNFDILKRFFKIYVTDFVGAKDLRVKLMGAHTAGEVEKIVLNIAGISSI